MYPVDDSLRQLLRREVRRGAGNLAQACFAELFARRVEGFAEAIRIGDQYVAALQGNRFLLVTAILKSANDRAAASQLTDADVALVALGGIRGLVRLAVSGDATSASAVGLGNGRGAHQQRRVVAGVYIGQQLPRRVVLRVKKGRVAGRIGRHMQQVVHRSNQLGQPTVDLRGLTAQRGLHR